MRFIAEVRIRTRCIRRRSRSRSARSSSDGIHSSGTRSRRHSSASTRASTLSVLHASGATSRTLRACATCTSQPAAASVSRTQIAPLIISTHARTSRPQLDHQPRQAILVGGTAPSPTIVPASLSAHHAARRYDQSIPRYSTAGPPSRGLRLQTTSVSCGEALLMTFHARRTSADASSRLLPSREAEDRPEPRLRDHAIGVRSGRVLVSMSGGPRSPIIGTSTRTAAPQISA